MVDTGIKYNAKMLEIKDTLKELKKLKMNSNSFDDMIKEIETTVKNEVKEAYDKFNKGDATSFLNSSLDTIYEKAVKKIDKINTYISTSYISYYKIQAVCNDLNSKMENINALNIDFVSNDAKQLLNDLKSTSSIDYEEEKELVEYVYSVVYDVLKLEAIYGSDSILFDSIINNEIDTIYISRLIKLDIENLKDDKDIKRIVEGINRNGFESKYYLDQDLIRLIAYIKNGNYNTRIKDGIIEEIDNYNKIEKSSNKNEKTIKSKESYLSTLEDQNSIYKEKIVKDLLRLGVNLGTIGLITFGSYKIFRNIDHKYKTVTETYDSITDETKVEESYEYGKYESVYVTVYEPWKECNGISFDHARNYEEFEIDDADLTYTDLEDYLKLDAGSYTSLKTSTEYTDFLLDNSNYTEDRYVVVRTTKDLDDCKNTSNFALIVGSAVVGAITTFGVIIANMYDGVSLFSFDYDPNELKKNLKQTKQELIELKNNSNEVLNSLSQLKNRIKNQYEKLPNALKEDKNVKEKMLSLEDNKKKD